MLLRFHSEGPATSECPCLGHPTPSPPWLPSPQGRVLDNTLGNRLWPKWHVFGLRWKGNCQVYLLDVKILCSLIDLPWTIWILRIIFLCISWNAWIWWWEDVAALDIGSRWWIMWKFSHLFFAVCNCGFLDVSQAFMSMIFYFMQFLLSRASVVSWKCRGLTFFPPGLLLFLSSLSKQKAFLVCISETQRPE